MVGLATNFLLLSYVCIIKMFCVFKTIIILIQKGRRFVLIVVCDCEVFVSAKTKFSFRCNYELCVYICYICPY